MNPFRPLAVALTAFALIAAAPAALANDWYRPVPCPLPMPDLRPSLPQIPSAPQIRPMPEIEVARPVCELQPARPMPAPARAQVRW